MNRTPIAYTRSSNINGYTNKIYDVIAFWRNDFDGGLWCDVAVYTEKPNNTSSVNPFGYTRISNYNEYMNGTSNFIACWPDNKPESIPLYL